jgi:GH25 family lysozyme M1 (1,4-beta-N-acetylmuramidase)
VDASLVLGVIMKATQGKYYVDPTCAASYAGAGLRGIPRGLYHFLEPNDISSQVDNFIVQCEAVGALKDGKWLAEIPPVLDVEYHPPKDGVVGQQLAAQVKAWLDMVEARTGVRPMVYTSENFWNFLCTPIYWTQYTENGVVKYDWITTGSATAPAWTPDYPLWTAQYPYTPDAQTEPARLPRGWNDWKLWQYSDDGEMAGIGGRVDVNVFNGTKEEWYDFIGGEVTPPPQETTMNKVTIIANTINVRSAPDATIPNVVRQLKAGNIVYTPFEAKLNTGGKLWIQITESPVEFVAVGDTLSKVEALPGGGGEVYPVVKFVITDAGGKYPSLEATWTPL